MAKKLIDYEKIVKEAEREEAEREARIDKATEYLEKTKRINKEKNRLKKLFVEIDKKKKDLVDATIADVAFMTITMQDLREEIAREGTTITYQNGENQWGEKQSPSVQTYLQMSQKLTAAMKLLNDCMPKELSVPTNKTDDFDEFVKRKEEN